MIPGLRPEAQHLRPRLHRRRGGGAVSAARDGRLHWQEPGLATSSISSLVLEADTECVSHNPWAGSTSKVRFNVLKDNSSATFFFDEPPATLTLNGDPLKVEEGECVTPETLSFLLGDKLDHILGHLRVLMVVNTAAAKEELRRIVRYFKDLEDNLPPSGDLKPFLADGSLAKRARYTKDSLKRRMKSVSHMMQKIANDEKVAKLNLAQQADYLPQAGGRSRTARNLSRRALESGTDFDNVMRAEVLAMAAHSDELEQLDDSGHAVSFYSRATTLEGIVCMIELAEEPEILDNLTAPQLLRLFNVVGIPSTGTVGDFPDPMSYRVTEYLPGAYVSMADLQMAWNQNKGGALTVPGREGEITNAIPFFEDERIQTFLQRYARSSLEYMASIGMRRMIAEVPKTYPYTICAGLWKMVEELDRNGKAEIAVRHFKHLADTYEKATEGMFDHILPLLEGDRDPGHSYNLGHNGITNMLGPLLSLVRAGRTQYLDRIIRALYSFESYQVIRRLSRDGGLDGRTKALDELLGVDFSKRATPLPEKFTRAEPRHCASAVLNLKSLEKYAESLQYVHYVTLVPQFFGALVNTQRDGGDGDFVREMKSIPAMNESSIAEALNLRDTPLDDFVLYNVVEGLLHSTKQSRIDKETDKPLLKDLGNPKAGPDMIAAYVQKRYAQDYDARLRQQLGEEKSILRSELINQLIASADVAAFVSLLADGNRRGNVSVTMDRDNCAGFDRLHESLLDSSTAVPARVEKLRTIYTGRAPSGDAAFNGGNPLRVDWKPLGELLNRIGESEEWDRLQVELSACRHSYRGGPGSANRHGHSNDLPSYFAFGCETLEDYHKMVPDGTWLKYIKEHSDCCGVREYLTVCKLK